MIFIIPQTPIRVPVHPQNKSSTMAELFNVFKRNRKVPWSSITRRHDTFFCPYKNQPRRMLAAVKRPITFETIMAMLLISMPYRIQTIPPGTKIQYVIGAISPALLLRKILHACGNPANAITPPDIVASSPKIVIISKVNPNLS